VDLACSSRTSTAKFSTAESRHQFTLASTRSSSDLSSVSATPETDRTNQASYGNGHSSSFVPAKQCRLTPRTRRKISRKEKKRRPEARLGSAIFGSKTPGEAAKPRHAGMMAGAGPRTLTECVEHSGGRRREHSFLRARLGILNNNLCGLQGDTRRNRPTAPSAPPPLANSAHPSDHQNHAAQCDDYGGWRQRR
jgi:hypothetical protein